MPAKEFEETELIEAADPSKQKALVRKLDLHIIPTVVIIYTLAFLDRVNIGNAKLLGMEKDLDLKGNQYQVAVSMLFVTYVLFETPSNLVLKRLKPNIFLPSIAVAWGIVATCTAAVQSYTGLIVCRLLMGFFEAGLCPGIVVYLTMFYTRRQLALRIATFLAGAALAGAVGGLIAYGVKDLDGVRGLSAWRWLMVLEGCPSIAMGLVAYFTLAEKPSNARYLTPSDRDLLILVRQAEVGQTASAQEFSWKDVREGVKDWQIWVLCIANFSDNIMLNGMATFLPSIIKNIGHWNAAESNALTVPVYALGIMTYLSGAYISDRLQIRGPIAVGMGIICVAGYCMLISHTSSAVSYAGCFVVIFGMYLTSGLTLTWIAGNKPRWGKRAFATGILLSFGNCAGIVMPFLYPNGDAPEYTMGFAVSIACVSTAIVMWIGMSMYYRWVNKRRSEGREDWKLEGKTEAEIEEMGDKSPRFVYIY
ncbi:hypothetical protein DOTSEDRAFT_132336 [Dothistroma septosporum NZE10]|uniref:Major facilitator superfamily (MFS) profile domain-containing protein n=1 Tax=Dothistroma septosporum (strain NZE10 / CBS 128990) TaxID=675120 RepID=M2YP62_DOTSN|nr:hypothetical protein DOTSEDRAFT_132336 [Dothistroma septosporum NZE10]